MGKRKRSSRSSTDRAAALAAAKAQALQALAAASTAPPAFAPAPFASPEPPVKPSFEATINGKGKQKATDEEEPAPRERSESIGAAKGMKIKFGEDGMPNREGGVNEHDEGRMSLPIADTQGPPVDFIGPVVPSVRQDVDTALQLEEGFQVPATAFMDFLDAAADEFMAMNPHLVGPSDVRLPTSAEDQIRKSILYYGKAPAASPPSKPRDRPTLQYLPMSKPQPTPAPPKQHRRLASDDSDLDADEFADVFGYGPVDPGEEDREEDREEEDDGDDDDDEDEDEDEDPEGSGIEANVPLLQGVDPPHRHPDGVDGLLRSSAEVEESLGVPSSMPSGINGIGSVHDENAMEIGSPSPPPHPKSVATELNPSPPSNSYQTAHPSIPAPASSSTASISPQVYNPPMQPIIDPSSFSSTHQALLSNALSAQFWAGYHTALLHHALGNGGREQSASSNVVQPSAQSTTAPADSSS